MKIFGWPTMMAVIWRPVDKPPGTKDASACVEAWCRLAQKLRQVGNVGFAMRRASSSLDRIAIGGISDEALSDDRIRQRREPRGAIDTADDPLEVMDRKAITADAQFRRAAR